VIVNCAAIPEALLESEMFGHERGAFTGAIEQRHGCFELADKGTLFLDEIAEISPGLQLKLLRALQERTIRRLGGHKERRIDFRLIAATNVDPAKAIEEGRLRVRLVSPLTFIAIGVPPLRERSKTPIARANVYPPSSTRGEQVRPRARAEACGARTIQLDRTLVAAIKRKSMRRSLWPPRRLIVRSCSARSSLS